jgi:hydrogenase-4 component B
MLLPMALLALVCAAIGMAPALVAGTLQRVSFSAFPQAEDAAGAGVVLTDLVSLPVISVMAGILLALCALLYVWYRRSLAGAPQNETVTWGCGYQRPTPGMQYSASSFAGMLTGLFAFVLKPHTHRPGITAGIFPGSTQYRSHVPEVVLELLYVPALERLYRRFLPIRKMQSGILQQYVFYILTTLVVLLLSDYM